MLVSSTVGCEQVRSGARLLPLNLVNPTYQLLDMDRLLSFLLYEIRTLLYLLTNFVRIVVVIFNSKHKLLQIYNTSNLMCLNIKELGLAQSERVPAVPG